MKILQIIDRLHLAGAQTMCGHLSVELKKSGHDVVVVSLYSVSSAISELLTENGINVIFLNKKPSAKPIALTATIVNIIVATSNYY